MDILSHYDVNTPWLQATLPQNNTDDCQTEHEIFANDCVTVC